MTDAIQLDVRAVANDIRRIQQRETLAWLRSWSDAPLPRARGGQVVQAIRLAGFEVLGQSGSHLCLQRWTGVHWTERITVPVHARKTLNPKTLAHLRSGLTKEMPMGHEWPSPEGSCPPILF
jgi:predicted RNA binding protein YcfA (HicA-like mRNA interferase family)